MFATGRRLGNVASRFHVTPSHLRHSHKPSIQSHDTTQETSLTIQLIVPPSTQPEQVEFSDTIALDDFVKSYQGSLRAPGPNGMTRILGPTNYKSLPRKFTGFLPHISPPFKMNVNTPKSRTKHLRINHTRLWFIICTAQVSNFGGSIGLSRTVIDM